MVTCNFGILLLVGLAVHEANLPSHFTNYTKAYRAARHEHRPMLVILNPERNTGRHAIQLAHWQNTQQRRQLLQHFVVVVLDTGTPHGKTMHRLFGNEPLPHVAVIDDQQRFQIYRSSEPPSDQRLAEILETSQTGYDPPDHRPKLPEAFCST